MSTSLPTCPAQKGGEKSEVTPQPLQAQCPQLLLITHAFHLFYQLCCPPLDIVKHLEFFFNCWAQNWKKNHSKWGCSNAGRPASSSNEPAFSLNLLLLLARFKKLSLLSKTSPSRLNFSWALVFVFSSCKYKLQLCNLPVWPDLD